MGSLPSVVSTRQQPTKPQQWSSSSLSLLQSLPPPWLRTRRVVLNLMLMLKLEPDILAMDMDIMDTQSWELVTTTLTTATLMLATPTTLVMDMAVTDHMDVMDMDASSETERTRLSNTKEESLNHVFI